MNFDIVIATRNRPEALSLSIPSMLQQSRLPRTMVIVDSSDNHQEIVKLVSSLTHEVRFPVKVLQARANRAHQRNVGIDHATSQVIMFPDDDALWWPGVAEAIMRVYERDDRGIIGGVCAGDAETSPLTDDQRTSSGYKMKRFDRFLRRIAPMRYRLNDLLCPSPFRLHGQSLWKKFDFYDWFAEENVVPVEYMTGFRMSFKRDAIDRIRFNEVLSAKKTRTTYLDIDACFGVARTHLLVAACKAQVYHRKFPSKEIKGYTYGFISILNYAYITCCHTVTGDLARRVLGKYLITNIMLPYLSQPINKYGRQRLRGAWQAYQYAKKMLRLSHCDLTPYYLECCDKLGAEK
jgi:glycosyltransferase involved in cell wall biosynthesis